MICRTEYDLGTEEWTAKNVTKYFGSSTSFAGDIAIIGDCIGANNVVYVGF